MTNKEQPISPITNEEDQKWIQIIEEWRQSGMSIAEWCRDNKGISYSQFNHKRRR